MTNSTSKTNYFTPKSQKNKDFENVADGRMDGPTNRRTEQGVESPARDCKGNINPFPRILTRFNTC